MRNCLSDVNNLEDTEAMGGAAQLEISILTLSHFLRKRVNIVVFIYFAKKKKRTIPKLRSSVQVGFLLSLVDT